MGRSLKTHKSPVHTCLYMTTRVYLRREFGWWPTSTGIGGWFPA